MKGSLEMEIYRDIDLPSIHNNCLDSGDFDVKGHQHRHLEGRTPAGSRWKLIGLVVATLPRVLKIEARLYMPEML